VGYGLRKGRKEMIDLKLIKIEGTQSRAALNTEVVDEYAEAMRCGAKFPPVKLFFDGSDYWLADGFHRYFGSKAAEIDTINADIENGSKDDAILYSIGSNISHGLRRTNADKRHAVSMILNHAVWSGWSDRAIATEAGVSHVFVANLRKELNEKVVTVTTTPTPALEVATEKAEKQEIAAPKESVKPHLNLVNNLDQEHQLTNEELAEVEQYEAELKAKAELIEQLLEADDVLAELKQISIKDKAMIEILTSRNNGLMNENAALSRLLKSANAKLDRMAKAA
jgi:hypothetical protein